MILSYVYTARKKTRTCSGSIDQNNYQKLNTVCFFALSSLDYAWPSLDNEFGKEATFLEVMWVVA